MINSAILKLGKIETACTVYRGVSGGLLPEVFWKPDEFNVRGGEIQPRYSRDTAEIQPRYSRDTAEIQPDEFNVRGGTSSCGWDGAETGLSLGPRCG